METATGSSDAPRVTHCWALDVPHTGESVTLTIKARMEPDPKDVSTEMIPSVKADGAHVEE